MVGIVILNYNNPLDTINCVDSVVKYNSYPSKIVVVDNASTDDSVNLLGEYIIKRKQDGVKIELVQSLHNGGYAQGNNIGLHHFENDVDVDYVMILNNDILFTMDIIPNLVKFSKEHPDSGLISPLLFAKDGKSIDSNCARLSPSNWDIIITFLLHYHDLYGIISNRRKNLKILDKNPEFVRESFVKIELPSGSCMLIKKKLFEMIDWFDPNTFLYYEENILYRKLHLRGKTNYMIPSVSCIHLGAQSTSKNPIPFLKNVEANSASYYLNRYGDMSIWMRFMAFFAFNSFSLRLKISNWIKSVTH